MGGGKRKRKREKEKIRKAGRKGNLRGKVGTKSLEGGSYQIEKNEKIK